jgi:hypothetical protein
LKGCNVSIQDPDDGASWYFDSSYTRSAAVDYLLQIQSSQASLAGPKDSICAVIGPVDPRAHEGVSVVTESLGIPQIAFATIDKRLDRADDFPAFVRVIPTGPDFAAIIALYVQRDIYKRDYIGIIYDRSDYGETFEDSLGDAEDKLGFESLTGHFIEGDDATIYDALGDVLEKGYRTILLITDRPAMLDDIARIAEELGLLGEGYFWIITGDALPPALLAHTQHAVDSPADKLLRGAALVTNYDRFVYEGESDPFLKEWRKQDSTLVDRLNRIQPKNILGNPFYVGGATYFETETPAEYASFVYDSVMAAGIGACRAQQGVDDITNHQQAILNGKFSGASGPVDFGQEGKTSRDPNSVSFGVYNVRPSSADENNMRR